MLSVIDLKEKLSMKHMLYGSIVLIGAILPAIFGMKSFWYIIAFFLLIIAAPLILRIVMKMVLYSFSLVVVLIGVFAFLGLIIWFSEYMF